MVSARGLGFRVRDRDTLASIDFALPAAPFLVVVGENGAGKTTLALTINLAASAL